MGWFVRRHYMVPAWSGPRALEDISQAENVEKEGRTMRKIIGPIVCMASLVIATNAMADFHDGVKCYQQGDTDCAVLEFRLDAEKGNSAAQFLIGLIFLNELSQPQRGESAEYWLVRAAENGNVQAQTELARMYRDGDGVDQDPAAMLVWYEKAANNGDVGAQLMVADTYAWAISDNPRFEDAYMWYTIAIDYWGTHAERARSEIEHRLTPKEVTRATERAQVWLHDHNSK